RLETEALLLAGKRGSGAGASPRPGGRVEVDIVHHPAVFSVLEMHLDCVADPHTYKGTRNRAIEGPEPVCCSGVEPSFKLHSLEIDPHRLRRPPRNRRRDVCGVVRDVRYPVDNVDRVDAAAPDSRLMLGRHDMRLSEGG